MRYPPAMELTQLSTSGTNVDAVFLDKILVAMFTAVQTGARSTSSIATTGVDEEALIANITELGNQGYTVTYPDSTHVVVSWQ